MGNGAGPHDVSAYSLPGIPWVTGSVLSAGSVVQYSFPLVTKYLTVRNTTASTTVAVGFTVNGLGTVARKFFTLTGGQEERLDLRVRDIFLSASVGAPTVEVIAGLSHVEYSSFPVLTGSLSGSTGWTPLPAFSGVG